MLFIIYNDENNMKNVCNIFCVILLCFFFSACISQKTSKDVNTAKMQEIVDRFAVFDTITQRHDVDNLGTPEAIAELCKDAQNVADTVLELDASECPEDFRTMLSKLQDVFRLYKYELSDLSEKLNELKISDDPDIRKVLIDEINEIQESLSKRWGSDIRMQYSILGETAYKHGLKPPPSPENGIQPMQPFAVPLEE